MARNVRDVLRSVDRDTQERGITKKETIQLFLKNGYGDRRALRRTNEVIVGCQLQLIMDKDTDEPVKNEAGEPLFTCVRWPYARHPSDIRLVTATVTDRLGFTHRFDDPNYVEKVLDTYDHY